MIDCSFCGYKFPQELGHYGCPNCLSEPMETNVMALSFEEKNPVKVRRSFTLTPDQSRKLVELSRLHGQSMSKVVGALIDGERK